MGPSETLEVLHELCDGVVEVSIVGLLRVGRCYFFRECPEDVVAGAIVDLYGDGRQRIGGAL